MLHVSRKKNQELRRTRVRTLILESVIRDILLVFPFLHSIHFRNHDYTIDFKFRPHYPNSESASIWLARAWISNCHESDWFILSRGERLTPIDPIVFPGMDTITYLSDGAVNGDMMIYVLFHVTTSWHYNLHRVMNHTWTYDDVVLTICHVPCSNQQHCWNNMITMFITSEQPTLTEWRQALYKLQAPFNGRRSPSSS